MNLRLLVFFAISVCTSPASSQFIAGNSGEGILTWGRVYLRDLYEVSVHRDPYFSPESWSFTVERRLHREIRPAWLVAMGIEKDPFLRKLSELNRIAPALGELMLDAVNAHHWTFTGASLTRLDSEPPLMKTLSTVVQLANRRFGVIHINRRLWDLMDNANRTALVIHEMTAALSPPNQKTGLARELLIRQFVGQVFSEKRVEGPLAIHHLLFDFGRATECLPADPWMTLSLNNTSKTLPRMTFPGYFESADELRVSTMCQDLMARWEGDAGPAELTVTAMNKPWSLTWSFVTNRRGLPQSYLVVVPKARISVTTIQFEKLNPQACMEALIAVSKEPLARGAGSCDAHRATQVPTAHPSLQ